MEHVPLMLARGQASGEPLEVTSPWSGETVGTLDRADATAINNALALATETFAARDGWLPAERRGQILRTAARLVAERR